MSAFVIFAIVLTVIYAIYYGVVISRDLYGKKEQQSSSQEIFEISSTEDEAVTEVNETRNGFSFSNDNAEESVSAQVEESDNADITETENTPSEEEQEVVEEKTEADKSIVAIYENMEQIQVENSVQLEKEEFRRALMNRTIIPGNLLKVQKDEL